MPARSRSSSVPPPRAAKRAALGHERRERAFWPSEDKSTYVDLLSRHLVTPAKAGPTVRVVALRSRHGCQPAPAWPWWILTVEDQSSPSAPRAHRTISEAGIAPEMRATSLP